MARIIEAVNSNRRIIKMSVDDILSVIREYQVCVSGIRNEEEIRNRLSDTVIYIPEDI